jgi:hypothetical protein
MHEQTPMSSFFNFIKNLMVSFILLFYFYLLLLFIFLLNLYELSQLLIYLIFLFFLQKYDADVVVLEVSKGHGHTLRFEMHMSAMELLKNKVALVEKVLLVSKHDF